MRLSKDTMQTHIALVIARVWYDCIIFLQFVRKPNLNTLVIVAQISPVQIYLAADTVQIYLEANETQ